MLFDLGWSEILVIGTVALIFIGPKDLPKALRVAGYWVRKARTLSREFQSSIDQMIREAELDEVRQELKKATEFNLEREFQRAVDTTGSLAEALQPPALSDGTETSAAAVPLAPESLPATSAAAAAAEAVELNPLTAEAPVPVVAPPATELDAPAGVSPTPGDPGSAVTIPPKS